MPLDGRSGWPRAEQRHVERIAPAHADGNQITLLLGGSLQNLDVRLPTEQPQYGRTRQAN